MRGFKMNNRSGFSLVELMVVVAIIGILAVIGIPQYQKFMAKARQAEAKTHLNSIFQGEASFFTEYNQYSPNLNAIGAGAVGKDLRYNAGFLASTCTAYDTSKAPPLGDATTRVMNGTAVVATSGSTWFYTATLADPTPATLTDCNSTVGASSYTASAWGNPTNSTDAAGNNKDIFSVDNQRAIKHLSIGL